MAVASRILRILRRKGATVALTRGVSATYNELTDTFAGGTAETVTVPAIETQGDMDRAAALGLTLTNPVTLILAALGLPFPPAPGMKMAWAGVSYTIRDVLPTSTNGSPVMWTVTGGL